MARNRPARQKGNSPKARRTPTRSPRRRLLIVCEGEVTEPEYLEDLKRHHRNPLIEISLVRGAGVPKTIVEQAVEKQKDSRKLHRKSPEYAYDEIWAVFDRDEHPNIPEAFNQARANDIKIAFSIPSFELWLLLHF